MKRFNVFALTTLFLLNGCSINLAADKQAAISTDKQTTNFGDLSKCKTRSCLIADGAEPQKFRNLPKDTEVFIVQKDNDSEKHGILNVVTLGIWDAVEVFRGHFHNTYAIRVTYEPGTTNIKSIALAR